MWQTLNSTLLTYSAAAQYNPARPLRVWSQTFILPTGRVAMYDVHYLCGASYDSGYSCPPRVSSVFCNCVKLSIVLTMSLSFRSNVNYIPPPQEVSLSFFFFFVFFLVIWAKQRFNLSTWKLILLCFWSQSQIAITLDTQYLHNTVCLSLHQPQDFKHTQSFMLWEAGLSSRIHCLRDKVPTLDFFSLEVNSWASNSCKLQSSSSTNPFGWVTTRHFARLLLTHLLCCVGLSLSLTFSALRGLNGFMRLCSPLVVRCYSSKWALIQGPAEISIYFAPSFCRPIVLTTFVFFYQRMAI